MAMLANVINIMGRMPKYPGANRPPDSPLYVPDRPPTGVFALKARIGKQLKSYRCKSNVIRMFLFLIGIKNWVLSLLALIRLEGLSLENYSAMTPKHCALLLTAFQLRNYLVAFAQALLGLLLSSLVTRKPIERIILGRNWISLALLALIATTLNFLYFYVQDCTGLESKLFVFWLVIHMGEITGVTGYVIYENDVLAEKRANLAKSTKSAEQERKEISSAAAAGDGEKNKCVV